MKISIRKNGIGVKIEVSAETNTDVIVFYRKTAGNNYVWSVSICRPSGRVLQQNFPDYASALTFGKALAENMIAEGGWA